MNFLHFRQLRNILLAVELSKFFKFQLVLWFFGGEEKVSAHEKGKFFVNLIHYLRYGFIVLGNLFHLSLHIFGIEHTHTSQNAADELFKRLPNLNWIKLLASNALKFLNNNKITKEREF